MRRDINLKFEYVVQERTKIGFDPFRTKLSQTVFEINGLNVKNFYGGYLPNEWSFWLENLTEDTCNHVTQLKFVPHG